MTLELLHKISKQPLPFTVTDLDEIDKLGSPRFQCNNWRAFDLVGSSHLTERSRVGWKVRIPTSKVVAQQTVHYAYPDLQQKVRTSRIPSHLLRL